MKKIQFFDEVFCCNILILCGDKEKCEGALEKLLPEFDFFRTFGEDSIAETISVSGWGYIVYLPSPIEGKESYWNGILAHELYHVVSQVMANVNVNDEETGAYYMEFLLRTAWEKLVKKK